LLPKYSEVTSRRLSQQMSTQCHVV